MRPLRARLVTSHSGGSGTPLGRHYGRSARSSLHWPAEMPVQETRPGADGGTPSWGRLQMPRWSAERRAAARKRPRRLRDGLAIEPAARVTVVRASRRSIPSAFAGRYGPHNSDNTLPRERRSSPPWIRPSRTMDDGRPTINDRSIRSSTSSIACAQRRRGAADQHPFVLPPILSEQGAAGATAAARRDPVYCHTIFWPVVPEEAKAWWRAILQSRRNGRTLTPGAARCRSGPGGCAAPRQRHGEASRNPPLLHRTNDTFGRSKAPRDRGALRQRVPVRSNNTGT